MPRPSSTRASSAPSPSWTDALLLSEGPGTDRPWAPEPHAHEARSRARPLLPFLSGFAAAVTASAPRKTGREATRCHAERRTGQSGSAPRATVRAAACQQSAAIACELSFGARAGARWRRPPLSRARGEVTYIQPAAQLWFAGRLRSAWEAVCFEAVGRDGCAAWAGARPVIRYDGWMTLPPEVRP